MNEISILLHLLSRKKDLFNIGATKKEIIQALNLKNKNKSIFFQNLITELSHYIVPLGLQVRFNTLNSHWYIAFDSELSDHINANPFENKPHLAATLFCILASCLKNSGFTTIQEIQKLRKKKSINEDLKELERKGYIISDKESRKIFLTPVIGYQLDMYKLFMKLSLKLKN